MSDVAVQQQTIKDETYNGWANRETWLASLWLGNSEDNYAVLCEAQNQTGDLLEKADWLEEYFRNLLHGKEGDPCLWSDLLEMSFEKINWLQVIMFTR